MIRRSRAAIALSVPLIILAGAVAAIVAGETAESL